MGEVWVVGNTNLDHPNEALTHRPVLLSDLRTRASRKTFEVKEVAFTAEQIAQEQPPEAVRISPCFGNATLEPSFALKNVLHR